MSVGQLLDHVRERTLGALRDLGGQGTVPQVARRTGLDRARVDAALRAAARADLVVSLSPGRRPDEDRAVVRDERVWRIA